MAQNLIPRQVDKNILHASCEVRQLCFPGNSPAFLTPSIVTQTYAEADTTGRSSISTSLTCGQITNQHRTAACNLLLSNLIEKCAQSPRTRNFFLYSGGLRNSGNSCFLDLLLTAPCSQCQTITTVTDISDLCSTASR